jgi:NADH pyrophosphatase NudC (nudix superfamily)
MVEFLHRVKVFVFTLGDTQPSYLLVKSAQGLEGCWGPLQGNLGHGEQLEAAIRREVIDDLGLSRTHQVIDLHMPQRWALGDEEVIEWLYGFQAEAVADPPRLARRFSEFRWAEFGAAYPTLELETDRAAILRLHTLLRAA